MMHWSTKVPENCAWHRIWTFLFLLLAFSSFQVRPSFQKRTWCPSRKPCSSLWIGKTKISKKKMFIELIHEGEKCGGFATDGDVNKTWNCPPPLRLATQRGRIITTQRGRIMLSKFLLPDTAKTRKSPTRPRFNRLLPPPSPSRPSLTEVSLGVHESLCASVWVAAELSVARAHRHTNCYV